MRKLFLALSVLFLFVQTSCKNVEAPSACGPVPSSRQLAWHEMETYAFVHFNMNTFTGLEWGLGGEDPKLFNPTELDCRQWARVCKENGLKGIILTAKHHDGFCLWPSKYTEHSVKNSPWKGGKGDVLKELSEACKEYGLKFGVYLSPWDRNHADYGKPEYITYFKNQLRELLTNYGDIFEVWFDGANGGDGYYGGANERRNVDRKTYYNWPEIYKIVRQLQPNAMLFSDAGPDCRWCGTESGWVGKTNWSMLRRDEYYPGCDCSKKLQVGDEDGTHWLPAEVDVSIRPGWYYHKSEDHKVRTLPQMLDIYYHSVGRGGSFLLNFPVDRRGLIHENDVASLHAMSETLKADFANELVKGLSVKATNVRGNSRSYAASNVNDGDKETYWATDDAITTASLILEFDKETEFNRFLVQEYIPLGQRVQKFTLEAFTDGSWKEIASETTIGNKRILRFPTVEASKIRFNVVNAKACPLISNIEVFNAPPVLVAPSITRNKAGYVTIKAADNELTIYYSLDGSTPNTDSKVYTSPFLLKGRATVKVIAIDAKTGKSSPVSQNYFDVSKKKWKVVGISSKKSDAAIDGNLANAWYVNGKKRLEIVIDLGETLSLKGFTYMPDQSRWGGGIISHYQFYVSKNGRSWGNPVSSGEFSNIKNNPIQQVIKFSKTSGRYIKLRAITIVNDEKRAGFAEIGVISE